jgi:hypothetical protein
MTHPDGVKTAEPNTEFEALHLARVRGMVAAEAFGFDLEYLVTRSLLVSTKHGYLLSPKGLEHHELLLTGWRTTIDLELFAKAYERFLAVNAAAKDACATWQRMSGDDESRYVAVDTLTELMQRAAPSLRRAARLVPRFTSYETRLNRALGRAGAGDARFITDPGVDSFHSVWFECHEDFLVTLGRSREDEGSH